MSLDHLPLFSSRSLWKRVFVSVSWVQFCPFSSGDICNLTDSIHALPVRPALMAHNAADPVRGISGILSRRQTAASNTIFYLTARQHHTDHQPRRTGTICTPITFSKDLTISDFPRFSVSTSVESFCGRCYVGKLRSWFWYQHIVLFCVQMFDQGSEGCLLT